MNESFLNGPHTLVQRAGRFGNRKTNRDHTYYSIVKIGWNTENSPGDPRTLERPSSNVCVKTSLDWCWRWSTGNCARNFILPYCNMVYVQNRIRTSEWDEQDFWDFEIQIDHRIQNRRRALMIVNEKKKENLPNSVLCRLGQP